MSFILIPNNGEGVQVNAWNWRKPLSRPNRLNFSGTTDVALALTLTWQTK
jgi:hypothetical protein